MTRVAVALTLSLCAAVPALAQFPKIPSIPNMDKVVKGAQVLDDLTITPEEEQQIGEMVSQRIRDRYGVMQDKAVHRYVTLVGTVLAQASTQPKRAWRFVVLDTDGVNAFAAPGGYIHVTRGALGLIRDEAELAGVLGHEIIHVTERHTAEALQKSKLSSMGIDAGSARAPGGELSKAVLVGLADRATEMVLAGFGRSEELESDQKGVALANKVGYAPAALRAFLVRLEERNAGVTQKQGLFASHPEMKERIDRLATLAASLAPASTATLEARYREVITFVAKPLAEVAQVEVEAGAAGLTGGTAPKTTTALAGKDDKAAAPPKKKGLFGMSDKLFTASDEKKSAQVTGSGGSRGVDTERNAKGGSNPAPVVVTLTTADIQQFKAQGGLK
jgi:predicted Zn-dependent protease